jgi:molecular chaperone GrpE
MRPRGINPAAMTTRKHSHEHGEGDQLKAADGSGSAEIERLEGKVAELEAALAEAKDRQLRLAADFDNFKKRTRQEQLTTIQHAAAELIGRLLPALDDLQKALEHTPAGVDEAWIKGVELSVRKLEEAMGAHGLEPIESVGVAFDPKLHEAIGHEETSEHPDDTVVQELRRGYRIRDRVVRPALVKVSRRPALPSAADTEEDRN